MGLLSDMVQMRYRYKNVEIIIFQLISKDNQKNKSRLIMKASQHFRNK